MTENSLPQRELPRLLHADDAQRIFFRGVVEDVRRLGFEHCAYLVGIPVRGAGWGFVITSSLPRSWQESCLSHGCRGIEPTIEHAKTSALPLTWSNAQVDPALAADAGAMGMNHGWSQPIRAAHGKFGVLTLARGVGAIGADELRAKRPMVQWLAREVHARLFGEFIARYRTEYFNRLSEREIEILRLTAEGSTAADISALTGVAERTINFHIGNVISKLGAANKTHAVTLALRLGLID